MRPLLLLFFVMMVAGCARNEIILPLAVNDPRVAIVKNIHVATMRAPAESALAVYSGNRAAGLSFAEIAVSIPKKRTPGTIVYPRKVPDLKTQFAAVGHTTNKSETEFIASINRQLSAFPPGKRTLFIFVHGYNTNFASGIFRQAQMYHDFNIEGAAINFSWASAGKTPLYLYDRDSAQIARAGLRKTLQLAAKTNASGIMLLGHSMGGFVTMETLREIGIRKEQHILKRIETLVLASPDIDTNVFKQQLAEIKPMPQPFVVFVSSRDRALQASQTLRGGTARLGEGNNIEDLQAQGITVVDLSDLSDGEDSVNHTTFATSKTLLKMAESGSLNRDILLGKKPARPLKPLGDGIGAVSDVAASIIYLPAKIAGVR